MTYILATYGLFSLPFLNGKSARRNHQLYLLTLALLFLFSAFRFEVGCDWSGYYYQFLSAGNRPFEWNFDEREVLWWGILNQLNTQGVPYPFANVISSAIFFAGVHVLAKRQYNPLAYLVLLFPVLIINMPMSGIRQGAAIGLICIALVGFIDRKPVKFILWTLLATGFHSSATVFFVLLPLVGGRYSRNRLLLAALLAIPGVYVLASGDAAELAIDRYVGSGIDAAGSAFRVSVLALSGVYFFVFLRKQWRRQSPEDYPLAHLFAMGMIGLIVLVPLSTVIGDRLGYYLIPVQAMIFAKAPSLGIQNRKFVTVLPYIGLALMFTVWAALSWHFQKCYVPYRTWIFGFSNHLWSGL